MRRIEIETWCVAVADRVVAGQPIEDTRVELKAGWPTDFQKVARQIAAHANAARGEPILWVIGLDEKAQTAPGASLDVDAADWIAQLRKRFDEGITPTPVNLAVPFGDVMLVALYFETDRPPYVVLTGSATGSVEREVPWRELNSTRSARRQDLLRILTPTLRLPEVEVLDAAVAVKYEPEPATERPMGWPARQREGEWLWSAALKLCLCPPVTGTVIPVHRSRVEVRPPHRSGGGPGEAIALELERPFAGVKAGAITTHPQFVVEAPGVLDLRAMVSAPPVEMTLSAPIEVEFRLHVVGAARELTIGLRLPHTSPGGSKGASWKSQG